MSAVSFMVLMWPGRGADQPLQIFSSEFERRDYLYLYCTMSAVSFIVLKWPGRGADQPLQSLVPNLKEEMIYTYTVQ
jgi:hypothetical protein